MCLLGTFSEYTVVPKASLVKIDQGTPLDKAALIGCGVTTGYGSAVRTGEVRAGDTVVVIGAGGIGMNAIQGARIAGALNIVAVDPVAFKREQAGGFGATHAVATIDEAWSLISDITRGKLADVCVLTTDVAEGASTSARRCPWSVNAAVWSLPRSGTPKTPRCRVHCWN